MINLLVCRIKLLDISHTVYIECHIPNNRRILELLEKHTHVSVWMTLTYFQGHRGHIAKHTSPDDIILMNNPYNIMELHVIQTNVCFYTLCVAMRTIMHWTEASDSADSSSEDEEPPIVNPTTITPEGRYVRGHPQSVSHTMQYQRTEYSSSVIFCHPWLGYRAITLLPV